MIHLLVLSLSVEFANIFPDSLPAVFVLENVFHHLNGHMVMIFLLAIFAFAIENMLVYTIFIHAVVDCSFIFALIFAIPTEWQECFVSFGYRSSLS